MTAADEVVSIDRDHARELLDATGTLLDDIASGRLYGESLEETAENGDRLFTAREALREALE